MMHFELGLEQPDPTRARSGFDDCRVVHPGGHDPARAVFLYRVDAGCLLASVAVTLLALAVFGFVKARLTGISPWRGGLQTVVTGGLAAAAAFTIARAIG